MRVVVQRVREAQVDVEGCVVGRIHQGLAVLAAVATGDDSQDVSFITRKLIGLRVFNDADGKMNCSIKEVGGEILLVSQFTLYGDCRKGNRPSFSRSASPEKAEELYLALRDELVAAGIHVATGKFQAMMQVSLVNDGPVTVIMDSKKDFF